MLCLKDFGSLKVHFNSVLIVFSFKVLASFDDNLVFVLIGTFKKFFKNVDFCNFRKLLTMLS